MNIEVIHADNPSQKEKLQSLGVMEWAIWEKEASEFPWFYDSKEICYLLQGKATVTPEDGEAVTFGAGDLVTFPQGMSCHWHIHQDVRKHYQFF